MRQKVIALARNLAGFALRMNPGPKQRFASVDVAHANNDFRVHDEILHRNAAAAAGCEKMRAKLFGDQRFGAEILEEAMIFIGVTRQARDATKTARIDKV